MILEGSSHATKTAAGHASGPCDTGAMTTPRTQPPAEVKPVSVSLSPEMVDRLDAAARRQQVSRSLLVREFIAAGHELAPFTSEN